MNCYLKSSDVIDLIQILLNFEDIKRIYFYQREICWELILIYKLRIIYSKCKDKKKYKRTLFLILFFFVRFNHFI